MILDRLVELLQRLLAALARDLGASSLTSEIIQAWVEEVTRLLVRYSTVAFMVGGGSSEVSDEARVTIARSVKSQVDFLKGFAAEIQEGREWQEGWQRRAESYAASIGLPYWQGKTKLLPLPALPRDGTTQCITHCQCAWEITKLEGEGNWDCFWRLRGKHNCQTCEQRSEDWSPLKIRAGRLVIE